MPSANPIPRFTLLFALLLATFVPVCRVGAQAPAGPPRTVAETPANQRLLSRLAGIRARVRRVEEAGPGDKAAAYRVNLPLARLLLEQAELCLGMEGAPLDQLLDNAQALLDALDAGNAATYRNPGLHQRAYISPADGSVQPYWVYLPKKPMPQGGWPLLVYLHGYVPTITKINPWIPGDEIWQSAEEKGFAVAVPYGRRNTDFEGIGEQDVLTVLEEVKHHYPVNADRVILGGPSMGGYGVYVIGLHHPHLFAGLAPMCGRSIPYVVERTYPNLLPPFKRIAAAPNVPMELAENAAHLPIFIQQGEFDQLNDAMHSRQLAARWRKLGYPVRYDEWKGHDHYIYWEAKSHAAVLEWAVDKRRVSAPREVTYVTYSPKYGRAYWLEILGLEQWGQQARIKARVGEGNRVEVQTTNVSAYALDLPAALVQAGKPLTIVTNGRSEVRATWAPDKPLTVQVSGAAEGARKTGALCGPVRECFVSPFLLVPGTAGDAASRTRLREWARRWAEEWHAFADGEPSVKNDRDITPDDMRAYNLVLFGDRSTNSVLARIAADLPVELDSTGYRLGSKRVPAKDLGLLLTYPNPLAPQRLVCVMSGRFWGEGLDINHKYDLAPDFILFRGELDGNDPGRTPRSVCAGYFDSRWQLSESLTWHE